MNAFSLLRSTKYIGAKELRVHLDKVLHSSHPYRVMHHNKPTITIIPDDQFLQLLEILEELKDSGHLEKTARRLKKEKKAKKNRWFWSSQWQKGESEVDREIEQGRIKRTKSAKELARALRA